MGTMAMLFLAAYYRAYSQLYKHYKENLATYRHPDVDNSTADHHRYNVTCCAATHVTFKKQISQQEQRITASEQYSRKCNLKIKEIPILAEEDLGNTFHRIGGTAECACNQR
ncbi:hypothetical protein MRX96_003314 [Rhipicephalus microplus]